MIRSKRTRNLVSSVSTAALCAGLMFIWYGRGILGTTLLVVAGIGIGFIVPPSDSDYGSTHAASDAN